MANENNAVSDFLSGLDKPQSDPFKETETPALEKEAEDEEEVDDEPLPFHKDPKVQRYVQKEVARALKDVKPTETERFREETKEDDRMTDVLTKIIGNDTPEKLQAIKEFRKELGSLEERGAQRALQQLDQQAQAAREEDNRAQQELDDSFEEIEETFNVDLSSNTAAAKKARNEFVDYVRKIAPKNEDGEVSAFPDLIAAFEEYQERGKRTQQPASRAKVLAARSMQRSSDATVVPTTGDKSWKSVEKLFSKL